MAVQCGNCMPLQTYLRVRVDLAGFCLSTTKQLNTPFSEKGQKLQCGFTIGGSN